jgi:phosphoribosyl-AMP cyclohydrolase
MTMQHFTFTFVIHDTMRRIKFNSSCASNHLIYICRSGVRPPIINSVVKQAGRPRPYKVYYNMQNLKNLKFNEKGLIPAIAQDNESGMVLMLAWMNEESLQLTLKTGFATYFSRSRGKLWKKGETSGHIQEVISITADCDFDCILLKVKQHGPACHTGANNCFFNKI